MVSPISTQSQSLTHEHSFTLNVKEAASFLGISERYLRERIKLRKIRYARQGKRIVFVRDTLVRYLTTLEALSA